MNRIISTAAFAIFVSSAAHAATLVDFESPTYTAGGAWSGVDGWAGSAGFAKISPDAVSGYTWVVEGQSGTVISGGLTKSFGGIASEVSSGIFDIAVSMQRPENPATAVGAWYVSDNLGTSRQAGIQFDRNDNGYQVLVWAGGHYELVPISTYSWSVLNSYETTISVNTLTDTFTASIRNLTTNGPVVDLGTFAFDGGNLEASDFFASGGVEVTSVSGATIFDNITVTAVPEPASMGVLGLVGLLALRRRVRTA